MFVSNLELHFTFETKKHNNVIGPLYLQGLAEAGWLVVTALLLIAYSCILHLKYPQLFFVHL
jgi:hypothetical protein